MSIFENPFRSNKVEFEARPVLWLSSTTRTILRSGKTTYLSGTRGSGKTSILRSLSTNHILTDKFLARQFPSALSWYGVFFQLNETFSQIVDETSNDIFRKTSNLTDNQKKYRQFVIFSQYLELQILDRLLSSIIDMHQRGHVWYDALEESRVVDEYIRGCLPFIKLWTPSSSLEQPVGNLEALSLRALSAAIGDYIRKFFNSLFWGDDEDDPQFFATDPGQITAKAAELILPIVHGKMIEQRRRPELRILIDDCESLGKEQQEFLNTLVRKNRYPVVWVISYVSGLYDPVSTIIEGQSLSDADRESISLDNMKEKDFSQLCCNVASLRLFYALLPGKYDEIEERDPLKFFDLRTRLGTTSLNQIIDRFVDKGTGEGREILIKKADQTQEFLTLFVKKSEQEQLDIRQTVRPYIQAITLERTLEPTKYGFKIDMPLSQLRQSMANRQALSFLDACREIGIEVIPYVGFNIVISLSDSCIRDFLDIFGEIVEEAIFARKADESDWGSAHKRVLSFALAKGQIDFETQRRAVRRSAQKKLESVSTLSKPAADETLRLVYGIAALTARVQQEDAGRAAERGLFEVDLDELLALARQMGQNEESVLAVLKRAEMNGFIRDANESSTRHQGVGHPEKVIRLHRRLSPVFGLSYRGPYGKNRIPPGAILELILGQNRLNFQDWARDIIGRKDMRSSYDPRQGGLFDR